MHNFSCFDLFFRHILLFNSFYINLDDSKCVQYHIYCSVAPKCMLLSHVIIILLTVTWNIMLQSIIFSGEKKLSIFFTTYYCKTHFTSIWMTPNVLNIIYIAQWHRMHVIIIFLTLTWNIMLQSIILSCEI